MRMQRFESPRAISATLIICGRTYGLQLEHPLMRLTRPLNGNLWNLLVLGPIYVIGLSLLVHPQFFLTPTESWIVCIASYWSTDDGCGLDGNVCAPFTNSSLDFRCPAQCSFVDLHNSSTVGNEQVDFAPLVVGGGDANLTYHGDSFLCVAAIQAPAHAYSSSTSSFQ